jgi:hypothetical protein
VGAVGLALVLGVVGYAARDRKAPAAPMTRVSVHVDPAEAHVYFDDVLLSGTPPSGTFRRDDARHMLRVEAAGYVSRQETTTLDSPSVNVDLSLERTAAAATVTAATTATTVEVLQPTKSTKIVWHGPRHAVPKEPATPPAVESPPPPTATTAPADPPAPIPGSRRVRIDKDNPFQTP